MRANKLVSQPASLSTSLSKLPPTHLLLYSLVFCSVLTVLYVAVIHFILPSTSPSDRSPVAASSPTVMAGCEVGGCSGELCRPASSELRFSTCLWLVEYRCYHEPFAVCSPLADSVSGDCEWLLDQQLQDCLTSARTGSDNYAASVQ